MNTLLSIRTNILYSKKEKKDKKKKKKNRVNQFSLGGEENRETGDFWSETGDF